MNGGNNYQCFAIVCLVVSGLISFGITKIRGSGRHYFAMALIFLLNITFMGVTAIGYNGEKKDFYRLSDKIAFTHKQAATGFGLICLCAAVLILYNMGPYSYRRGRPNEFFDTVVYTPDRSGVILLFILYLLTLIPFAATWLIFLS